MVFHQEESESICYDLIQLPHLKFHIIVSFENNLFFSLKIYNFASENNRRIRG